MFARFRYNVARYPRLFTATLVLAVVAEASVAVPKLVGIDTPHTLRLLAVDFIVSLALAVPLYRYLTSGTRTGVLLNVLDHIEGRDVCTVSAHVEETEEEEEFVEDEEENAL